MILTLSPVLADEQTLISVQGDVLTINGQVFDFGPLAEGATLPRAAIHSRLIAGDVKRVNGEINAVVLFFHGSDAGESARFPNPVVVTMDGPVPLPESGHAAEESHEQH